MISIDYKKILPFILIILVISFPFVLVNIIHPEWLGRLIAIGYFNIFIIGFCAVATNTKSAFKQLNKDLFKTPESMEKAVKRINITTRFIFLILMVWSIVDLFGSYRLSIQYLIKGNKPSIYIGTLTGRSGGSYIPFSNFYHESLSFDGEKKTDNFFQLDFHKPLKSNSRYQFTYIPETRLILEIKELP